MQSSNDIYRAVRDEIIGGKLNPGERLVEKELCERLGTTRGYVRDALKMLSADGFVAISRGKGATVTKISYQETKDLYELLALLEAKSVELASPGMSPEDLDFLRSENRKMRTCIDERDRAKARKIWQEANFQFHRIFAERSENQELRSLVESIRWRTFDFRYVYLFERYFPFFVDQHEGLIHAIQAKNFKKAKKIMEDHVSKASKVVLQSLEHIPSS